MVTTRSMPKPGPDVAVKSNENSIPENWLEYDTPAHPWGPIPAAKAVEGGSAEREQQQEESAENWIQYINPAYSCGPIPAAKDEKGGSAEGQQQQEPASAKKGPMTPYTEKKLGGHGGGRVSTATTFDSPPPLPPPPPQQQQAGGGNSPTLSPSPARSAFEYRSDDVADSAYMAVLELVTTGEVAPQDGGIVGGEDLENDKKEGGTAEKEQEKAQGQCGGTSSMVSNGSSMDSHGPSVFSDEVSSCENGEGGRGGKLDLVAEAEESFALLQKASEMDEERLQAFRDQAEGMKRVSKALIENAKAAIDRRRKQMSVVESLHDIIYQQEREQTELHAANSALAADNTGLKLANNALRAEVACLQAQLSARDKIGVSTSATLSDGNTPPDAATTAEPSRRLATLESAALTPSEETLPCPTPRSTDGTILRAEVIQPPRTCLSSGPVVSITLAPAAVASGGGTPTATESFGVPIASSAENVALMVIDATAATTAVDAASGSAVELPDTIATSAQPMMPAEIELSTDDKHLTVQEICPDDSISVATVTADLGDAADESPQAPLHTAIPAAATDLHSPNMSADSALAGKMSMDTLLSESANVPLDAAPAAACGIGDGSGASIAAAADPIRTTGGGSAIKAVRTPSRAMAASAEVERAGVDRSGFGTPVAVSERSPAVNKDEDVSKCPYFDMYSPLVERELRAGHATPRTRRAFQRIDGNSGPRVASGGKMPTLSTVGAKSGDSKTRLSTGRREHVTDAATVATVAAPSTRVGDSSIGSTRKRQGRGKKAAAPPTTRVLRSASRAGARSVPVPATPTSATKSTKAIASAQSTSGVSASARRSATERAGGRDVKERKAFMTF